MPTSSLFVFQSFVCVLQINGRTLVSIFREAGCLEPASPSCAACLGGPADTYARMNEPLQCVSTTNRNFPGRMGHKVMCNLISVEVSFPANTIFVVVYVVVSEANGSPVANPSVSMLEVGASILRFEGSGEICIAVMTTHHI